MKKINKEQKEKISYLSAVLVFAGVGLIWLWFGFKIAMTFFLLNGITNIFSIIMEMKRKK